MGGITFQLPKINIGRTDTFKVFYEPEDIISNFGVNVLERAKDVKIKYEASLDAFVEEKILTQRSVQSIKDFYRSVKKDIDDLIIRTMQKKTKYGMQVTYSEKVLRVFFLELIKLLPSPNLLLHHENLEDSGNSLTIMLKTIQLYLAASITFSEEQKILIDISSAIDDQIDELEITDRRRHKKTEKRKDSSELQHRADMSFNRKELRKSQKKESKNILDLKEQDAKRMARKDQDVDEKKTGFSCLERRPIIIYLHFNFLLFLCLSLIVAGSIISDEYILSE